jgi:hypothetical protein
MSNSPTQVAPQTVAPRSDKPFRKQSFAVSAMPEQVRRHYSKTNQLDDVLGVRRTDAEDGTGIVEVDFKSTDVMDIWTWERAEPNEKGIFNCWQLTDTEKTE